jgi:hypothetical protein
MRYAGQFARDGPPRASSPPGHPPRIPFLHNFPPGPLHFPEASLNLLIGCKARKHWRFLRSDRLHDRLQNHRDQLQAIFVPTKRCPPCPPSRLAIALSATAEASRDGGRLRGRTQIGSKDGRFGRIERPSFARGKGGARRQRRKEEPENTTGMFAQRRRGAEKRQEKAASDQRQGETLSIPD